MVETLTKTQVKVKDMALPVTEIPKAPCYIGRATWKAKFGVICRELFNLQDTLWKVGSNESPAVGFIWCITEF